MRKVLVRPEELVGTTIDAKYPLLSIVGGGGMGVVYRTVQPSLNKPLAIKLLRFDEGTEGRVLARFNRELEIVAQLTHPNIVNVVAAGQDDPSSLHYVVMELVEGETLEDVLLGNRMSPVLALEIISQTLSALSEPHKHGVIHRDVKPANVMITVASDGKLLVKLLDFGIARKANVGEDAKITTTATVIGSPAYMSPEAVSGGDMDSQADIYSLGICFYEMLTGQVPFTGTTPVAVMLRQAVEEPPEITEVLPEFDFPEIISLVKSMLEKEAADRPAGARVIIEEIERIMRKRELVLGRFSTDMNVVQGLARHLTPRSPVSPTLPTETWKSDKPANQSFEGWMVSSEFVASLPDAKQDGETDSTVTLESHQTLTANKAPEPSSSKVPIIIGVVFAALLAAGVGLMLDREPPVELGTKEPQAEKAPIVEKKLIEKVVPVVKEDLAEKTEALLPEKKEETKNSQTTQASSGKAEAKVKAKTKTKKKVVDKKESAKKPILEKTNSGGEEKPKKVEAKIETPKKVETSNKDEDEKRLKEGMKWLENK